MMYLVKRLRSQLQGGTREITKVAQTFSEIGTIIFTLIFMMIINSIIICCPVFQIIGAVINTCATHSACSKICVYLLFLPPHEVWYCAEVCSVATKRSYMYVQIPPF